MNRIDTQSSLGPPRWPKKLQNLITTVLTKDNEYYTIVGVLNLVELFKEAAGPDHLVGAQTPPRPFQNERASKSDSRPSRAPIPTRQEAANDKGLGTKLETLESRSVYQGPLSRLRPSSNSTRGKQRRHRAQIRQQNKTFESLKPHAVVCRGLTESKTPVSVTTQPCSGVDIVAP